MKIIKSEYDKEHGTQYFDIIRISNWDLERIYLLLKAEKARAIIVKGYYRGSKDLLEILEPIAKERGWNQ